MRVIIAGSRHLADFRQVEAAIKPGLVHALTETLDERGRAGEATRHVCDHLGLSVTARSEEDQVFP